MSKVYIGSTKNKDYLKTIQAGLDFIYFGDYVNTNTKIFIKPNLTFPNYRPGVMTNPQVLGAAITAIREYTPHIFIGDSDSGGYYRFSMDEVYRTTGILDLCEKLGVTVVNLSKVNRKTIHFSYQKKSFKLDLPGLLLDEIDYLVTMPVPKVHANTTVSLTFKNQWGCIPENKDRLRLHPYFRHVILEVNKAVKSQFAIIDGTYGLNENGPMCGTPVDLNWILASDNIGAGDLVTCELMQIPINSVAHLRYAQKLGVVPSRDQVQLNCDVEPFINEKFYLKRKWTDIPGYLAFQSPALAYLAYFSPLANFLHKVLYLFREPFYDYSKTTKPKA